MFADIRETTPEISSQIGRLGRDMDGVEIAATEFPPSYRRASVMQASLAAVCLLSSVAAWLAGASFISQQAGKVLGRQSQPYTGFTSLTRPS